MDILIIKLGATGDVVRTTPLLRRLDGNATWITAAKNTVFRAVQKLRAALEPFAKGRQSAKAMGME